MLSATLRAEGKILKPTCYIITVTTAGTPVALTTDKSISVNAMYIIPHPSNGAGPYYIGNSTLNVSTFAGIIAILAGTTDSFSQPQSQSGNNQLSLADYYVDVTTSGDKFLVTTWTS